MRQTTIGRRISCSGIGLHSGKEVGITLRPAAGNAGIVFHVRTPDGSRAVRPAPDAVTTAGLATTLGGNGVSVATVEHLAAALRGLGVDNIHVDVDGGEVPVMDGSAAAFAELISKAGIRRQSCARRVLRIKRPVRFAAEGKWIRAEAYDGFFVDYFVDFPHPAIGAQRITLDLTPDTFSAVASARTFGFLRDVEMLHKAGLGLGGSLDNAIILDDTGVLNPGGLRYEDEFVRHKLLDFIGDTAMSPLPLQGRFTVHCSGHGLNNAFLRHIFASRDLFLEERVLDEHPAGHLAPATRRPAARICAG
ncbi:MAG: UDP-3-O-acyl-N-acetylglucosamine deacetylase [Desulfovibrio sp.]|nr:UDP-3-O-acyl-N-acetylglucosamine deacetylase [Desulfovibrio sp.]